MLNYSIMSLDEEHIEEFCADIERQIKNGIATAPLFSNLSSVKNETGTHPEFIATSITVGLSAIKMPFSGSNLFLNCEPVRRT